MECFPGSTPTMVLPWRLDRITSSLFSLAFFFLFLLSECSFLMLFLLVTNLLRGMDTEIPSVMMDWPKRYPFLWYEVILDQSMYGPQTRSSSSIRSLDFCCLKDFLVSPCLVSSEHSLCFQSEYFSSIQARTSFTTIGLLVDLARHLFLEDNHWINSSRLRFFIYWKDVSSVFEINTLPCLSCTHKRLDHQSGSLVVSFVVQKQRV
jgi:hypothetical protein